MKIVIETIPHSVQRYNTVGDWYSKSDDQWYDSVVIKVSETNDWRYNALIAVHELIELLLCRHAGIGPLSVDAWDMEHEEAGDDPAAPYHHQHVMAERIERQLALELGVQWVFYEDTLNKLTPASPNT